MNQKVLYKLDSGSFRLVSLRILKRKLYRIQVKNLKGKWGCATVEDCPGVALPFDYEKFEWEDRNIADLYMKWIDQHEKQVGLLFQKTDLEKAVS